MRAIHTTLRFRPAVDREPDCQNESQHRSAATSGSHVRRGSPNEPRQLRSGRNDHAMRVSATPKIGAKTPAVCIGLAHRSPTSTSGVLHAATDTGAPTTVELTAGLSTTDPIYLRTTG